ncbi:ArsR/SmtB family transcription factor [Allosalinactinospora lopnorensis]|uniref:ArsR/SmtB family transcription factor n=1 Tax=Allosalinactinospora lopnorensis TaxID=1352348 RepID=UPI000623ECD9|nr:metalloregulator ArsR/SmtB family transcription factor [Allosalinactinospora lopnorensis]
MAGTGTKTALLEQFARIGRALANPARLELLDLLAQGERSVDDLARAAGMRLSNTSAQLKALQAAGLVHTRKEGVHVYHRLAGDDVEHTVEALKDLARTRLAAAEQAARAYLGDVAALEPIGHAELARRLNEGTAVVIDVRPAAEYAASHIPGALSIPLDELAARLDALPRDTRIVAYCRGPYCAYAPEAARTMRAHGLTAHPLQGGLPQWRRAGLPTENP